MNLKELAPQKTKRLNKVMESRFGFAIDYDNLSVQKAQRLAGAITESLNGIRKSYGIHTAEKNPKYMEMLMVKEGLETFIRQQQLTEGELESAEAILAAKGMVDSIQDMIEDVSKMMNEQLPPLLDSIRDQIGTEQADSFKAGAGEALRALLDNLGTAREALDSGARQLAGEQVATDMSLGGDEFGGDLGGLGGEPEGSDFDAETDGFAATDAAAGGDEALGRERR
jgi:hypothetical protein